MKPVVIDANLIFAAVHPNQGRASRIFFFSEDCIFLSPNSLVFELILHKEALMAQTKAPDERVYRLLEKVVARLIFVNEGTISVENFIEAHHLCKDVDENDTPYVALALQLDADLWTRDQELKTGLRANGFTRFFDETPV
jgi:predicted nucleic acid-binding protein